MKSRRECHYTRELNLETLVWTRGPNFPLSSLHGRLMCPRCRSRRVVVMFQPPTVIRPENPMHDWVSLDSSMLPRCSVKRTSSRSRANSVPDRVKL